MTEPTTVFDLSPQGVEELQAEVSLIGRLLSQPHRLLPEERGAMIRRRDRIIAALHTLEG